MRSNKAIKGLFYAIKRILPNDLQLSDKATTLSYIGNKPYITRRKEMKVIDTTGTNVRIKRTPGTNDWFYSINGAEFTKASFKKCVEVVQDPQNSK
jgi:hypothetical protein